MLSKYYISCSPRPQCPRLPLHLLGTRNFIKPNQTQCFGEITFMVISTSKYAESLKGNNNYHLFTEKSSCLENSFWLCLILFCALLLCFETVSVCGPGWPLTHRYPFASASQVFGLHAITIHFVV